MTPAPPRPAGRPPLADGTARPHCVYLTPAQADTARRLGGGNLSEGVRRALDLMPQTWRKNSKPLHSAEAFARENGLDWPEDADSADTGDVSAPP